MMALYTRETSVLVRMEGWPRALLFFQTEHFLLSITITVTQGMLATEIWTERFCNFCLLFSINCD